MAAEISYFCFSHFLRHNDQIIPVTPVLEAGTLYVLYHIRFFLRDDPFNQTSTGNYDMVTFSEKVRIIRPALFVRFPREILAEDLNPLHVPYQYHRDTLAPDMVDLVMYITFIIYFIRLKIK